MTVEIHCEQKTVEIDGKPITLHGAGGVWFARLDEWEAWKAKQKFKATAKRGGLTVRSKADRLHELWRWSERE